MRNLKHRLSFLCSQLLYILEWNKRLYITEMGKEGNLNDFLLILQMKQGNEKAFDNLYGNIMQKFCPIADIIV